jgi:hypothetical protein
VVAFRFSKGFHANPGNMSTNRKRVLHSLSHKTFGKFKSYHFKYHIPAFSGLFLYKAASGLLKKLTLSTVNALSF